MKILQHLKHNSKDVNMAGKEKKGYEYKDLRPINSCLENSEYINILSQKIDESECCNIALAGPYGAGKSSIIDVNPRYWT